MLLLSDPLFWLIVVGMTLPWGVVVWLGFEMERWKSLYRWQRDEANYQRTRAVLAESQPAPLVDEHGAKVLPFPLHGIEGGKHRRRPGEIVGVPFKGKVK
jgi:hypothetical protein